MSNIINSLISSIQNWSGFYPPSFDSAVKEEPSDDQNSISPEKCVLVIITIVFLITINKFISSKIQKKQVNKTDFNSRFSKKEPLKPNEYNKHELAAIKIQRQFRLFSYRKQKRKQLTQEIEELTPELLEQGKQFGITQTPLEPIKENPIDRKKAQEWIEMHPDESRPLATRVVQAIVHRSFPKFQHRLSLSIESFNEKLMCRPVEERKYILIVNQPLSQTSVNRSNSWATSLALRFLKFKPEAISSNRYEDLYECLEKYPNVKHLLTVDDACYSGSQLFNDINEILNPLDYNIREYRSLPDGITLHIAVPFINLYALKELKKIKKLSIERFEMMVPIKLRLKNDIKALVDKELIGDKESSDRKTLTYFEHKIADYVSTLDTILKEGKSLENRWWHMNIYYEMLNRGFKTDDVETWNREAKNILKEKTFTHRFIPFTQEPYKLTNITNMSDLINALIDDFGDGTFLDNADFEGFPEDRYLLYRSTRGTFIIDKERSTVEKMDCQLESETK